MPINKKAPQSPPPPQQAEKSTQYNKLNNRNNQKITKLHKQFRQYSEQNRVSFEEEECMKNDLFFVYFAVMYFYLSKFMYQMDGVVKILIKTIIRYTITKLTHIWPNVDH